MPVDEDFPHIGRYANFETDEHLRLKNLAVAWLLERGFEADQIEDEYTVTFGNSSGRTDVYATDGSTEVFIECEHTPVSLSRGGQLPAENGETVYVFTADGIHIVETEERTAEKRALLPGDETITREFQVLKRWRDLPELDDVKTDSG